MKNIDPKYIGAYRWHCKYIEAKNQLDECKLVFKELLKDNRQPFIDYCEKYGIEHEKES